MFNLFSGDKQEFVFTIVICNSNISMETFDAEEGFTIVAKKVETLKI